MQTRVAQVQKVVDGSTLGIFAGVPVLCALSMYGKSPSLRRPFTRASNMVNRRGVCWVYTFSTPCKDHIDLVLLSLHSAPCPPFAKQQVKAVILVRESV